MSRTCTVTATLLVRTGLSEEQNQKYNTLVYIYVNTEVKHDTTTTA